MVIVKIAGGLGNQLFQYAFGKYLEMIFKYDVKYDVQIDLNTKNFTKRELDIEKLRIDLKLASPDEIKKYIFFKNNVFWRLERKFSQLFPFFNKRYIVQDTAHTIINNIFDNCYYDGYWQCYNYVDDVRDALLKEIKISENFYSKYSKMLTDFENFDSVAIHIRRGDYINIKVNAKLFEVCNMSYYNLAIKSIKDRFPNSVFYIFTQDTEWAKENFIGEEFHFVEGNSAIDDMLLMSFCKHNIIANSTFSWWGAWLNKNPQKIVIAPKNWYNGDLNETTKDLIPAEWIRL